MFHDYARASSLGHGRRQAAARKTLPIADAVDADKSHKLAMNTPDPEIISANLTARYNLLAVSTKPI